MELLIARYMPKVGMKSFGIRQYMDRISKDYFTRLKKLRLKTRVKSNVVISTMVSIPVGKKKIRSYQSENIRQSVFYVNASVN